jgi:steroid 5-alpha reductase family enzyme
MTLRGTVDPPSYLAAMLGSSCQLFSLLYVWSQYTSAGPCIAAPVHCLRNFSQSDIWGRQVACTLACCLIVWLISLYHLKAKGHSDPSIVDRLWNIQPWVYCWHFYISSGGANPRLLAMTGLATIWGLRLTFNFFMKGGFSGGEDYRWAEVRKWYPGWRYEAFNIVFVCFFQQCVILAFTSPAVLVLQSSAPLTSLDFVAAFLFLLFLAGETLADFQMFRFQTEKYRRLHSNEPLGAYSKGFIDTGIWAFSRHPNYFCEVSLWSIILTLLQFADFFDPEYHLKIFLV